jgi:hypothetical protein
VSDERDMEKDEERLAEVVSIHPDRDLEDEDAPVDTKPRGGACLHRLIRLDVEAHRVYCRECDREVDPFAFLKGLAADWERYARHRKESKRRAEAAHERLREILRLEQNARARLRRLDPAEEKKAPPRPWGEGTIV